MSDRKTRRCWSGSPSVDRRGIVLIVVLVLVVMIALAGFGFVNSMSTEYGAVSVTGSRRHAEQTLLSAEVLVRWYLKQSPAEREDLGGHVNNPTLFDRVALAADPNAETTLFGEEAAKTVDENGWYFSVTSPAEPKESETPVEENRRRSGLTNESNKLNLRAVLKWDQLQPGAGREALTRLPGVTPEIADAILDWIDPDETPREFGAESKSYAMGSNPYRTPNRLPASLHELLLVRGVTPELLFGANKEAAGGDPNDETGQFDRNQSSSSVPIALAEVLTLHSAEKNVGRSGAPRIHLNGPISAVYESLQTVFPPEVANYVVLYRQYGPAAQSALRFASAENVGIDVDVPPRHAINAITDLLDSAVTVPGRPTIHVRSPLQSDSDALRQWLPLLLSETSPTAAPVLPGRLNLNTAPAVVLRALPFFSEETIDRILERRQSLAEHSHVSTSWLLTEGIISPGTFGKLEPWITSGGDVFSCRIVTFRGSRGPVDRVDCVFDGASPEPRRLEWHRSR